MRFLPVVLAFMIVSCSSPQNEDQKFELLAKNYVEQLLTMSPELATSLGDHRFDHRISDYSMAGIEASRGLTMRYLDSLKTIEPGKLNPANRIDFRILKTNLDYAIFQIDTLREYEWNPLSYNAGGAIYGLLARDFAPLKNRLASAKARMEALPSIIAAAKANLKNPPKIYTETAIMQNPGTIGLVKDEINAMLKDAPEMVAELAPVQAKAVAALEEYGVWLKNDLLPRSNGDFRIGEAKFRRKLYFALESDLTKEQILAKAEADLRSTREALYQTALPLFTKWNLQGAAADTATVIKSVLDKLAGSHPTNETIVGKAKDALAATTEFVRANNLATVPGDPIKIVVMPEFQRGVAVAYCDNAGPLEKNGETFFSISPTPADWSKERVASFFREYNDYMLQDLTIHEAMPGHYLQLAHAKTFKAPTMIRDIFGSGTFVEGWATYAEQVMVEKGYGGPEVKMQQLKMRLRLIINAIIDQKIHTESMTEKEAMDLMMKQGFQEDGEAAGKWRRALLSSTQLSTYYVGNIEVNDLRRAYEAKFGTQQEMKTMHDTMLSFGSPAARYIKEAMGL